MRITMFCATASGGILDAHLHLSGGEAEGRRDVSIVGDPFLKMNCARMQRRIRMLSSGCPMVAACVAAV